MNKPPVTTEPFDDNSEEHCYSPWAPDYHQDHDWEGTYWCDLDEVPRNGLASHVIGT